jgi:hypothetical protein
MHVDSVRYLMDEKTAMWMMKTHKFQMQKPEIPQDRMKKKLTTVVSKE